MVNDALSQLEELFASMYEDTSKGVRPSIARHAAASSVLGTRRALPLFAGDA